MNSADKNTFDPGLVVRTSNSDFETTYNLIKSRIEANPNLKVMLEIDHSKNAISADLTLSPTRVILFGNPKMGTKLMQENPTAGIDLPQKIIVFADNSGKTSIAYNDPQYINQRHGLSNEELTSKISSVLNKLTDVGV